MSFAPAPPFSFGVVVLAAGHSRRMGAPKALLPWDGTSIIDHHLLVWRAAGARRIAVVVRPEDADLRAQIAAGNGDVVEILNPRSERGMRESVRSAAAGEWLEGLTHVALVLVDQPQVSSATLAVLLVAAEANPIRICQPVHRSRRGHPLIFPRAIFSELASDEFVTLRDWLSGRPGDRHFVACEDAGVLDDLDTRDQYDRALAAPAA